MRKKHPEALRENLTTSKVEAKSRRCVLLPGDLRSHPCRKNLVTQTVQQLSQLNTVVNNAVFLASDLFAGC